VGDPVAIEPGVPCSCNKHTREGRYNLDPDIKFFATPPHHGSLAQVRRVNETEVKGKRLSGRGQLAAAWVPVGIAQHAHAAHQGPMHVCMVCMVCGYQSTICNARAQPP
jgi:threonine dehydrogenase-like Zn-dependent dehydrogenase